MEKINKTTKLFSDLNDRQQDLRSHLDTMRRESLSMQLEIARFELEIKTHEVELEERRKNLEEVRVRYQQKESVLNKAVSKQQETLCLLQKNVLDFSQRNSDLMKECSDLRQLREELVEIGAKYRSLQHEHEELLANSSASEQMLSQAALQNNISLESFEQFKSLSERVKIAKTKETKFEQEISNLKKQLIDSNQEKETLQSSLKNTADDKAHTTALFEQLQERFENTKTELTELMVWKGKVARDMDELEELLCVEKESKNAIVEALEVSETRTRIAEDAYAQIMHQKSTFESATKEISEKYEKLQSMVESLETVKLKSEAEASKLRKESLVLSQQVSSLRSELLGVKGYLKGQSREFKDLRTQLDSKEIEIRQLTEEKQKLEDRIAVNSNAQMEAAMASLDQSEKMIQNAS